MKQWIGYCGLDCEVCDARIATINHDEALRKKTAALWSALNGVEITAEMIHCTGCRVAGEKTQFCDAICAVRKCAAGRGMETCADCAEMEYCEILKPIVGNNAKALENLRKS